MPDALKQVDPVNNLPGQSWLAQDANARRATLTRVVVRISREALQGESLHPMLQGICACIVAEFPVAIASVILLNEENTQFVKEVYAGELTVSPLALAHDWPVSRGAAGRCARTGQAQLIADVDVDPDYVVGNSRVRSEYLVPIRHGQRMHGVLNLESTRTDFFDAESCAVFDAVSHLVASAIHFARMADDLRLANSKLQRMSMSDGLTGIANRRCFDERLLEDWSRMAARNESLALLLVDADAFKPLNDASGHLYGDECLRELARVCEGFVASDDDLVARFGGEELVLVLPGRSLEEAREVAESLRAAVEAVALPHPDSPVSDYVTISIGVSAIVPDPTQPPETLVAMADRALYSAKLQGRNRVQVYAPGR